MRHSQSFDLDRYPQDRWGLMDAVERLVLEESQSWRNPGLVRRWVTYDAQNGSFSGATVEDARRAAENGGHRPWRSQLQITEESGGSERAPYAVTLRIESLHSFGTLKHGEVEVEGPDQTHVLGLSQKLRVVADRYTAPRPPSPATPHASIAPSRWWHPNRVPGVVFWGVVASLIASGVVAAVAVLH